ncbi:MAG: phenylacetate--CoA ligase family protein, partial [Kiritimatiellae bacterium]|nr:phenylacetate--CoA ligase family protein [Kiritimatiellia bacterium]
MAMWNRKAETLSRDELAAVQLKGLKKSLARVWGNEFYSSRLKKGGIASPEDIKSLDDLPKLPFLTKEDFRVAYPLKMNCVPRKDLLEFHQSSGSTGTPVVMAYTKNDLNQWAECMARCFTMAGLEKGDAFQIMPTFGLFNGGFGCYHGCRKAGLFAVPASSGNTERQIKLMRDFKVKGFCSVVSYVPRLIEK